ncbi:MAG: DUF507 family protein [Bdellovibrionales bacterium]|nr:DUF507 family protein [Bdellovibrionales bacterium]
MKMTDKQIQRLVKLMFKELKDQGLVTFKESEDKAVRRSEEIVKENFKKEVELDHLVNKMMDDLERQNPGEFQRFKMFPLLKKRLAKEKGFIL